MKISVRKSFITAGLVASALAFNGCVNDLDRQPFNDVTSATVYNSPTGYQQVLAKIYAGLAVTGQSGPAGKPDIQGVDEGASNYLRQLWSAQELPTDEAVIAWNDNTIQDFHQMDWSSADVFTRALYYRIFYQITLANEFIRESSDAKLAERGISGTDATNIKAYRAEARFLRALSYYHALDLYGNVPFVTETDAVGSNLPRQIQRTELFNYVESELKAIETELVDARKNEYGRADKAAAWTLLARLYLNAEVYTGQKKFTEAITYSKKVIDAGYALEGNYADLFKADNNTSREIIFPITFDGNRTKTWGGTTFLVCAPIGGSMKAADFGVNGGWAGIRTTKSLVNLFPTGGTDKRAMFYTAGQSLEINDVTVFTDGYAVTKWSNRTKAGANGSDPNLQHPDTDFPLFRLADVYLTYAEAVLRGGTGGDVATALGYVNQLRQRAYGSTGGNLTTLSVDQILDERGRELYWEGYRRTDLIRYGKFTTTAYLWPWKGGTKEGRGVESFRNLYPLPASDVVANPNLKQNPNY
ncbi:RagB/SusD family nutrient uptake outer membrane protein [Tellurirhabdus rosea]|uniref:RagB/SusD family nutrient uptake outer membrane protein n=1 Tax=Tellurirhabdus rosea TaxID=2674997 RepID=UPI00224FEBB7|nr:RagB/SusD family nutrient uptake outer membrane protein [Tellurirhabdus rosea]